MARARLLRTGLMRTRRMRSRLVLTGLAVDRLRAGGRARRGAECGLSRNVRLSRATSRTGGLLPLRLLPLSRPGRVIRFWTPLSHAHHSK